MHLTAISGRGARSKTNRTANFIPGIFNKSIHFGEEIVEVDMLGVAFYKII